MNKPVFHSRFLESDFEAYLKLLDELDKLVAGKLDGLTPAQRRQYGKVGNSVLEWDSRVHGFMVQRPEFTPLFLDKDEFTAKLELHIKVRPIINRLKAILETWEDTESLISFDVDNNARCYYQNVKMLAAKNVPNAQPIYKDLLSRYNNGGRKEVASEAAKEATKE